MAGRASRNLFALVVVAFSFAVLGLTDVSQGAAPGTQKDSSPDLDCLWNLNPEFVLKCDVGDDSLYCIILPTEFSGRPGVWDVGDYAEPESFLAAAQGFRTLTSGFSLYEGVYGESLAAEYIVFESSLLEKTTTADECQGFLFGMSGPELPHRYQEQLHTLALKFVGTPNYSGVRPPNVYVIREPDAEQLTEPGPEIYPWQPRLWWKSTDYYYERILASETTGDSVYGGELYQQYLLYERAYGTALLPMYGYGACNCLVYRKLVEGPLFCWALDQRIRAASQGASSLRDATHAVYSRLSTSVDPNYLTLDDTVSILRDLTGQDFRQLFLDWYSGKHIEVPNPEEQLEGFEKLLLARADEYLGGNRSLYFVMLELTLDNPWSALGFVNDYERLYAWADHLLHNLPSTPLALTESAVQAALTEVTGRDQSDFFEFYAIGEARPSVEELSSFLTAYLAWVDGRPQDVLPLHQVQTDAVIALGECPINLKVVGSGAAIDEAGQLEIEVSLTEEALAALDGLVLEALRGQVVVDGATTTPSDFELTSWSPTQSVRVAVDSSELGQGVDLRVGGYTWKLTQSDSGDWAVTPLITRPVGDSVPREGAQERTVTGSWEYPDSVARSLPSVDVVLDGYREAAWDDADWEINDPRGGRDEAVDIRRLALKVSQTDLYLLVECESAIDAPHNVYEIYLRGPGFSGSVYVDPTYNSAPRFDLEGFGPKQDGPIAGGVGDVVEVRIPLESLGYPSWISFRATTRRTQTGPEFIDTAEGVWRP
jgi:hypothetical protein